MGNYCGGIWETESVGRTVIHVLPSCCFTFGNKSKNFEVKKVNRGVKRTKEREFGDMGESQ